MPRFLFSAVIFLSAFLLFSIQPMAAKALLPIYGGTPAVWTVCMLFFQLLLLLAYGYACLHSRINNFIIQRLIHSVLILLSLFFIINIFRPVAINGPPEWSILYNLLTQLGLPIFVLAAASPLLQFAYSKTKGRGAADPYFLYAASNLGSLIALLNYPWLIERFLGLNTQFYLWRIGYGINLLLLLIIFYLVSFAPANSTYSEPLNKNKRQDIFLWIGLAFIPCSLMLGVSQYISTDIAATPLFWVIPLALYLLSFVLSFTSRPLIPPDWAAKNAIFFLIFIIIGFILPVNQVKAWLLILVNLLGFFMLAFVCHRKLYERRPLPKDLTIFYLCLALGGMLAGVFNGILARHLFNQVYEYPLTILLSLLVLRLPKKSLAVLFICTLFALVFLPSLLIKGLLLQGRSFYAVNRVLDKDGVHVFVSQSTVHGLQDMSAKKPLNGFVAYYGTLKPIVEALKADFKSMAVTVLGLGTGTLACQFRQQDKINMVEIDQQVIDIAKNTDLFTYLRDCPKVKIIKNDGRLAMEALKDSSQKILVMDAFNSDAIPTHLLTREAFDLYKRKITEDGVILVNLSNRHLNLLPVINAIGRSLDLMVFYVSHNGDSNRGQFASNWAMLTANERLVPKLTAETGWRFVADDRQLLWTDDYSNILPLLKW